MPRYADIDKAMELAARTMVNGSQVAYVVMGLPNFVENILNNAEVEAEPIKHGRWLIGVGENGEPIGTYCLKCGWSWVNGVAAVNLNKALSLIKTPRCPWCGAKMDEVKE